MIALTTGSLHPVLASIQSRLLALLMMVLLVQVLYELVAMIVIGILSYEHH